MTHFCFVFSKVRPLLLFYHQFISDFVLLCFLVNFLFPIHFLLPIDLASAFSHTPWFHRFYRIQYKLPQRGTKLLHQETCTLFFLLLYLPFKKLCSISQRMHLILRLTQFFHHFQLQTIRLLLRTKLHLRPTLKPLPTLHRWVVPLQMNFSYLKWFFFSFFPRNGYTCVLL